jgi:hypothetical protein
MASTQTKDAPVSMTPTELAGVIASATAQAVQTAMRPENTSGPPAFWNGFGTKGFPELSRRVLFCGVPQYERDLSRDEIALFNAITTPGLYGPDKTWRVAISGQGTSGMLQVSVQGVDTIEGRLSVPSLVEILQTIVREQAGL